MIEKNITPHSRGLYLKTFDPSIGGTGSRLNKARKRLKYARKCRKLLDIKNDNPMDIRAMIKLVAP